MKNLALIGMMGCGKTTLAKALALRSGRNLFSCDDEIEKEAGMGIPEIFNREGEKGFRTREGKCVQKIASRRGLIVDCGGGLVVCENNVLMLKRSCVVVFIRRPMDSIMETLDTARRPLARDPEQFKKLCAEREPLYLGAADIIVDNDDFEKCLKKLELILEDIK